MAGFLRKWSDLSQVTWLISKLDSVYLLLAFFTGQNNLFTSWFIFFSVSPMYDCVKSVSAQERFYWYFHFESLVYIDRNKFWTSLDCLFSGFSFFGEK